MQINLQHVFRSEGVSESGQLLYDVWLRSYGASKLRNFRILAIPNAYRLVTSDYDFSTW